VILDIDERSLATLSGEYGRWPWPRSVLAEGMQKVSDAGARAVLLNVMLSDPDKANPDSDAVMDLTAQMVRPIAFPLIRLNKSNDTLSQLKVNQINGAKVLAIDNAQPSLAAILPMFATMHDRLGVTNQKPDDDGIIRKYPFVWEEEKFSIPSVVKRTLEVGRASYQGVPDIMSLNWRNKKGRYYRMSFSDFLALPADDLKLRVFKDSMVVLGVSAPGLGQTKGTSVTPIEDDNEILATAIDDALHGTYLRFIPDWAVLIINLLAIWTLVVISTTGFHSSFLNKAFLFAQSGLGSITLLSASYTNYLIDLSDSMSFGLGVFAAIKLVDSLDNSWTRAKPGFRRVAEKNCTGSLLLIGYLDDQVPNAVSLQKFIEKTVGMSRFIRIDDLFGGESFISANCAKCRILLVLVDEMQEQTLVKWVNQSTAQDSFIILSHELVIDWNPDDKNFQAEVSPLILQLCSDILNKFSNSERASLDRSES
jgi:CHASE2 domain-containing sensor protein